MTKAPEGFDFFLGESADLGDVEVGGEGFNSGC